MHKRERRFWDKLQGSCHKVLMSRKEEKRKLPMLESWQYELESLVEELTQGEEQQEEQELQMVL